MADVDIHSGGLRPLDGAIVGPAYEAGSAISHDAPAVTLASDGTVDPTAGASAKCIGLYIANERKESNAVAGDMVTVVQFGRVAGFVGLTPGTLLYLSANAGKLATTGTVPVAYAETEETVMFMPGIANTGGS